MGNLYEFTIYTNVVYFQINTIQSQPLQLRIYDLENKI